MPRKKERHQFEVFADYHQFFLIDENDDHLVPEDISNEDIERRMIPARGVVTIFTARNMTVPVTIEVHSSEPAVDLTLWDHVVEGSLEVKSGKVVVMGCTDYYPDSPRVRCSRGWQRVRAHYGDLESLSDDGLDGADHYMIQLWPAPKGELVLLKEH